MKSSRKTASLLTVGNLGRLGLVTGAALLSVPAAKAALEWKNIVSASSTEAALYRVMPMPVRQVLGLRPPREAVGELTTLMSKSRTAEIISLRAMNEEAMLDFSAAEKDWKEYAEKSEDRVAAKVALAEFYQRRLRYSDEIQALLQAGALKDGKENLLSEKEQKSWAAFERALVVARQSGDQKKLAAPIYDAWIARYPDEKSVYSSYLEFLLDQRALAQAEALVQKFQHQFPTDEIFPVKARALIQYRGGSIEKGLAVYDSKFQPLWPQELIEGYFELLKRTRSERKYLEQARAALQRDPENLSAAARIFHYYRQTGRTDAAQQVLTEFRLRKTQRGTKWNASDLATLARLNELIKNYPEAARFYYAQFSAGEQEPALAGLISILLRAPEQPIQLGSADLSMYRDIGSMDDGPGYLNAVLSIVLNSTSPSYRHSEEEQRAVPYFHREEASELLRLLDSRFPASKERGRLHAAMVQAYATYAQNEVVIREGKQFLTDFASSEHREEVALLLADAYARTEQLQQEFAVYDQLLSEEAKRMGGVPLGLHEVQAAQLPSTPATDTATDSESSDDSASEADEPTPSNNAFNVSQQPSHTTSGPRSEAYSRILERYLARLVAKHDLPGALQLLKREIDHNPNDPGLYERLAQFLEQNRLGDQQEQVYERAIQQFQDRSWYHKLARFYLRRERRSDFLRLSERVTNIFSGTDLEEYFAQVSSPSEYAQKLNEYAIKRFPHDLVFVRNLLGQYKRGTAEWDALIRQHWFESPDLRDRFFEYLARTEKLQAESAQLNTIEPSIAKSKWNDAAAKNPVATRFAAEARFWNSQFEEGAPMMAALAQQFPADPDIGERAASVYRSLAAFDPRNTEIAVKIEKNLSEARPGDRDLLATIGDIYADREMFSQAAPYWNRMAQVRPGEAQAYLESATVYWDYFDFDTAAKILREGRANLGDASLYSYQLGAIEESRHDYSAAIKQYATGALRDGGDERSRVRLLELARRSNLRDEADRSTASLVEGNAPAQNAVQLRVSILEVQNRPKDVVTLLESLSSRTNSFDLLEWLQATARQKSLVSVERAALLRQIAISTDPVRKTQLQLDLVHFFESRHDDESARRVIQEAYAANPKILGVVRAAVDFYWRSGPKQQSIDLLQRSADQAYTQLSSQLRLEAAQKQTELGDTASARKTLQSLRESEPWNQSYIAALAATYAKDGEDKALAAFYEKLLSEVVKAPLPPDERNTMAASLRRAMIPSLTKLKNFSGAVDQYAQLINRYSDDEALIAEAADYAREHGIANQLVGYYQQACKASPRDSRWPIALARIQVQYGQYAAAAESYIAAIRIRPDRSDLHADYAKLLERLLKFDDAAAEYQRLYDLRYHDAQWLEKLATVRARQGKTVEAVAALQKAFIENRPVKASNYFEVARRLEKWDMLPEAKEFAEKGAEAAGRDLLANPDHQSGAVLYATILARLREHDAAHKRLQAAVADADSFASNVSVLVTQVEKNGITSVTDKEWRNSAIATRKENARQGLAAAMRAIGTVAGKYFTPEEKSDFQTWLAAQASAATPRTIESVYLPTAQTAGLGDLESKLEEGLLASSVQNKAGIRQKLIEVQNRRMKYAELGDALLRSAQYAKTRDERNSLHQYAATAFRSGDLAGREIDALAPIWRSTTEQYQQRYYDLLLAKRPQVFLDMMKTAPEALAFSAIARAVQTGNPRSAVAAVHTRAAGISPVWDHSYSGLLGLYFSDKSAEVGQHFITALGDAPIGDRLLKRVSRNDQLAGNVWFYYGSRYGEWLSLSENAESDGFLSAAVEQAPANTSGYMTLAEHYASTTNLERALLEYQHILDLQPMRPDVHERIAMVHWRQHKRDETIADLRVALMKLDDQINRRGVPASFWTTASLVLHDVGSTGTFAELRPEADRLLRDYVRFNGTYELDSLLQAAYTAAGGNSSAVDWITSFTQASNDPNAILSLALHAPWMPAKSKDPLFQVLVARARESVKASGENTMEEDQRWLSTMQVEYADYLADRKEFDRAAAVLGTLPKLVNPPYNELLVRMRVAEAKGTLEDMLASYNDAEKRPSLETLKYVGHQLQNTPQKAAAAKVLEFVYANEIAAHNFAPENFLGLAEIRLQRGDVASAQQALARLSMNIGEPFENLEAAGALLAKSGHHSEAVVYYDQLAKAEPWNSAALLKLIEEKAAAGQDKSAVEQHAASLAANGKADYETRTRAASFVGAAPQTLGSAELDLIAKRTVDAKDADRPFYHQARVIAAKATPSASVRETLLLNAVADYPERDAARIPLFESLADAGKARLALSCIESQLRTGQFGPTPESVRWWSSTASDFAPQVEGDEDIGDDTSRSGSSTTLSLTPAERAAIVLKIAGAFTKVGEYQTAAMYLEEGAKLANEPALRNQFRRDLAEVRERMHRQAENARRAPTIHRELDQEQLVLPRLVAAKTTPTAKGAQQ